MHTKRFQITSENFRLQAILDLPDDGETWPLVIVNHAGAAPKDAALFAALPALLTRAGIAVCRFDPRGVGESEGAGQPVSFWTRWVDMSAVVQQLSRDERFLKTGLIGSGLGAVVSLWWGALHSASAVVCLGLPAPKALGSLPRVIENLLPMGLAGPVPHPKNVLNTLLIYGERDKEAAHAEKTAAELGTSMVIVSGTDKSFSQVKPKAEALTKAAEWFQHHLTPMLSAPSGEERTEAHDRESEPGPNEAAGAAQPDFLPPE